MYEHHMTVILSDSNIFVLDLMLYSFIYLLDVKTVFNFKYLRCDISVNDILYRGTSKYIKQK